MNIWEGLKSKRSIRRFTDQPISDDDARRILDAGRRAPSGYNAQPWRFIAVRDRDMLGKLSKIGRSTGHVAGAAMAVVILSPDRETLYRQNIYDVGQTATYMMLAAHELGIASCPANVHEPDTARDLLGFPEDWKPFFVISFGYPAETGKGMGKAGRKPFDDIVRWERW